MKHLNLTIVSILVFLIFLTCTKVLAATIFEDTFTVTGGGDINYNYSESGRQTGIDAPLQYSSSGITIVTNAGATAGKLTAIGDPSCTFSPDKNFTDYGNFSIQYEITRLGSGNWASVEFGHDAQNTAPWSPSGGMSIRFEENGSYVVQDGWPASTGSFTFSELTFASSPTLKVKIVVSQPGFPAGGDAHIALFINEKPYPLFSYEGRACYVYTRTGFTNNYVSLLGFDADFIYDNFKITTSPNSFFESKGWTNDADTSISSTKIYSHAVCLGTNIDVNVNGKVFTGAGTVITGTNWEIQYPYGFVPVPVDTFNAWAENPNIDPTGRSLVQSVMYDWISDSCISISGLTPGLNYAFTLYVYGIGPSDVRNSYFASNIGGDIGLQDMNAFGINEGQLLTYNYVAPESGILSIATTATNFGANAQWGWFAFSNEVTPPNAPDSISASQGTFSDKVRVTWTSVEGAQTFSVFRGNNTNFSSALEIQSGIVATNYDDASASPAQYYYYWVKAANTGGLSSAAGPALGYTSSATPPDKPSNVSPASFDVVNAPAIFTASAFSDPGGHAFAASKWESSQYDDFSYSYFKSGETIPRNYFTAPASVIREGTNYWRVKYMNEFSTWSDWSDGTSFIFVPATNGPMTFFDTFNVNGSGDANFLYDSGGRQFGNAAPLTYKTDGTTEAGTGSSNPYWLTLGQDSGASPNHSFTESPKFKIEFELKPHNLDGSADWCSIGVGKEDQSSFSPSSDSGFGNLFYANGTFQTYSGDTLVGDVTGLPTSEQLRVVISAQSEDFDYEPATLAVFVNDMPMVVDSTTLPVAGMTFYDYVRSGGFYDENYVTFFNNNDVSSSSSAIDNLIVMPAPKAVTTHQWTGDADSLIDPNNDYTHKVNLNGDELTINGVTFEGTGYLTNVFANGAPEMTKTNWAITASGNAVGFFTGEPESNFVTGISHDLAKHFAFPHGSFGFQLSDLTPYSSNTMYIYTVGFDPKGAGRIGQFASSYGGAITNIDMDLFDKGGGLIVQYDYIASRDGKFSLAISPGKRNPGDTPCFHVSAFANIETGVPEPIFIWIIGLLELWIIVKRFKF